MKAIHAVIQVGKLHSIREALADLPSFPGMTVTRAEGCGSNEDKEDRDSRQNLVDFSPKVRLEILAPDEQVDEILKTIHTFAHTGQLGDGVTWVTSVDQFHRIRF